LVKPSRLDLLSSQVKRVRYFLPGYFGSGSLLQLLL